MIEEVTRYKTNDGVLHGSLEAAEKHIVAELSSHIGELLESSGHGLSPEQALSRKTYLDVIDAMVGDIDKANRLYIFLHNMLKTEL